MYNSNNNFILFSFKNDEDYSSYRWTVDEKEDLNFIRRIYKFIDRKNNFTYQDVLSIVKNNPYLLNINKYVKQKKMTYC